MTASRSSHRSGGGARTGIRTRRVVLAAVTAGLGTALALAGCSSGLITQTATQVAPVPGADFDASPIALRNLQIVYAGPEGYPAGGDAPLAVRIFNNGLAPVTLTGVSADKAAGVALVGTPDVITPTQSPPTPAPTPSGIAPPTATASVSPDGTASPTPTPSPTPPPTTAAPAPGPISITIPPQSFVLLVPGEGETGHLRLTGLTEAIAPGESATITFTFTGDGAPTTVRVQVPLAPPVNAVPRATPIVEPGHAEPAE